MRTGHRTKAVATAFAMAAALAVAGCTPGVGLPVADDDAQIGSPVPSIDLSGSATPSASDAATGSASAAPGGAVAAAPPAGRAPGQTFAVGSRQLDLNRGADRPLRTVLWYPAAGSGGSGAAPASGVFPLVLFSHGLTATPESYQRITTRMAAAGFIVAAPAYPFTNGAASSYNPADLLNQPADGSAVISGVLALNGQPGDPLAGHINADRIAAAGHSGGGYTTIGLLTRNRDNRLRAAIVIAGGGLGGAYTGAAVSTLFVHGDRDPIVTYGTGRAAYTAMPWPKAFLTITGGDHSTYLFSSNAAGTAVAASMVDFLRWTLYGDSAARAQLPSEASASAATTFETSL